MKQKRIRLLSLLLVAVMLCSVALFSGCEVKVPITEEDFNEFLNNLFIESVTSNTITLHYTLKDPSAYGIEDFEPTIYDLSMDDIDAYYQDLQDTWQYLISLSDRNLTQEQKYILKMLIKYYELNISAEGLDYYGTYLDSISGLPSNMPINFAEYKFYTEKDVQDYLALLNQFPTLFEQALDYERTRIEMGLGLSDSTLDTVIQQCNDFISHIDDNYLILTFDRRIDNLGLSSELTAEYKEQNYQAFTTKVVPAYENMAVSLEEFKGQCVNDKGLCYFERGTDYYQYLTSYYTGTDYTLDELVDMCTENLVKYKNQFIGLYTKNPTLFDKVFDASTYGIDPTTYEDKDRPEAAVVLEALCTDILSDLQIKMLDYVPALSDSSFSIYFVEESLEDSLSPAFYMIPPIDDYKNNTIYVNLGSVDSLGLYSTLAHEGYPGHLYQTVYFNDTNPNPIRNVVQFDGYVEGWAVYMENYSYVMYDFGTNNETITSMAYSYSIMALLLYSRVDLGVNYQGWTVSDTQNYINALGLNGDIAQDIMDMVISSPATYLKYSIGYLEMIRLQNYAKKELGSLFDMVEFNTVILDIGPMQFSIVEEAVQAYIDSKLAS
ncbi:MAG TPA: DUF885 domain-containing protein [Clostridia bacterium]|nr:DUF885 domain-containing protein [Clostridia bacterium]